MIAIIVHRDSQNAENTYLKMDSDWFCDKKITMLKDMFRYVGG